VRRHQALQPRKAAKTCTHCRRGGGGRAARGAGGTHRHHEYFISNTTQDPQAVVFACGADEAGQAVEPEALVPLSLLNPMSGCVMLCGDPKCAPLSFVHNFVHSSHVTSRGSLPLVQLVCRHNLVSSSRLSLPLVSVAYRYRMFSLSRVPANVPALVGSLARGALA